MLYSKGKHYEETYTNRTGSEWKLWPKLSHSERKPVPSSGTYILDLDDLEVKQYFDDKTNDQRCFVDLRRCNDCWKSIYDVTARPDLAVLIWFICSTFSTCFLAIFNVPILWLYWFILCSIRGTHLGGNLTSFFFYKSLYMKVVGTYYSASTLTQLVTLKIN